MIPIILHSGFCRSMEIISACEGQEVGSSVNTSYDPIMMNIVIISIYLYKTIEHKTLREKAKVNNGVRAIMMGQRRFILGYKKGNTLFCILIQNQYIDNGGNYACVEAEKYGKSCTELTVLLYTHNYSKKICFQKKKD